VALGNYNWLGNIKCFEDGPETPRTEAEVIAILRGRERYPSPVRPLGSRHSMTACMAARRGARWGTAVDMTQFTRLRSGSALEVDRAARTAVVPAGRIFVDVARELRDQYGLTFNVITELGTLTVGAGACGATKDSSTIGADHSGQICSGVIGMRLIPPDGVPRDLKRGADPEFEALCSSYGLFGIVTEVTFQLVPHVPVSLRHEEIQLEDFERRTAELLAGANALFLYLFPFEDPPRIVAEVRCPAPAERARGGLWLRLRNVFWLHGLHWAVRIARRLPDVFGRALSALLRFFLVRLLDVRAASPVDQIVDFRDRSPRFTFSMWAFQKRPPAGRPAFADILRGYFAFCRSARLAGGFHSYLPHVSYHIAADRSSLLSYSWDGDVWTLDPIASGEEPGWGAFLEELNERASAWGGKPLFNQTPQLTRGQVDAAFGERLDEFEATRRAFDPEGRMLNDYFASLLGVASGGS
jgi:FAD/FMN-containing dehydrogenase